MSDLHVAAAQFAAQLVLVVAGYAQGRAGVDHVADEDDLAPVGMGYGIAGRVSVRPALLDLIAERPEERHELVEAAVNVADDVERPALLLAVTPERLALDGGRLDLLDGGKDVDGDEALPAQVAQRALEGLHVPTHDLRAKVAVRTEQVALDAHLFGHVQHD